MIETLPVQGALLAAAAFGYLVSVALRGRRAASASPSQAGANQALQQARGEIDRLTMERDQVHAVLESLAEGVIAVNAAGHIILMNTAAGLMLGFQPVRASGQPLLEAIRHHELHEVVRRLLEHRTHVLQEITVFHPLERTLRLHGTPCEGRGGLGPSAVLVIQDMTEANQYEQLRKEFVANVSHELKSPLTSIRSLTETLLHGALEDPSANRRFVQLVDEDATRLGHLIDDLLALSEIESQAVPLKLGPVPLRAFIESMQTGFEAILKRRQIAFQLAIEPDLVVKADPDRLRQILSNLIDNAINYNRDGGQVAVSAMPTPDGQVAVQVADTGIGIPAEDLPRIFERFYRVDKARSRALGGTGLGLSIVKHLVERHGGQVSVTSDPGRGSQFRFTLPAAS